MRKMLVIMGVVVLGGVMAAWAQDPPPAAEPERLRGDELRQLDLRQRALELQARENEVHFQRELHAIQLQKQQQLLHPPPGPALRGRACLWHGVRILMGLCLVVHVLLTVWVYQDIRRRNTGSGLWIAITLLTGFPGALVYALTRLGDAKTAA